jgi:crossover junction endodeoxyribonuclease RusA
MASAEPGELLCEFVVIGGVPISAQSSNKIREQAWMDEVKSAAQGSWVDPPIDGEVAVFVTYFHPGAWKLDLDNMAKPIIDAITGVVWVDDKQLVDLHPARRDLDGRYKVSGISMVVAEGFASGEPFVHVKITTPPDQGILL